VVGPSDGVKPREVLVSSFERQDPNAGRPKGPKSDREGEVPKVR